MASTMKAVEQAIGESTVKAREELREQLVCEFQGCFDLSDNAF